MSTAEAPRLLPFVAGMKYQTRKGVRVPIPGAPDVQDKRLPFIRIKDEILILFSGYASDGATGALDSDNAFVAFCVHDAYCRLTNLGILKWKPWRRRGDKELIRLLRANGVWAIRAWWWWRGVRLNSNLRQGDHGEAPLRYAPAEGVEIVEAS